MVHPAFMRVSPEKLTGTPALNGMYKFVFGEAKVTSMEVVGSTFTES
jgi:hypothetical protein